MAQPPDDPFWDTLDDDVTPPVPRGSPVSRAPQGARPVSPISVITEPDYSREEPQVSASAHPGAVSPQPLGAEPVDSSPHLVTSSLRVPEDMPLGSSPGDLRTTFSNQAVMIADLVRERLGGKSYGKAFYRLRIDEPDGPSTAGGLHARQPLSLVPRMDATPAIVCGWVDVSTKDSQLRSYAGLMRRHQSRQGGALHMTAEEYERFLDELMNTLWEGGIRITLLVPEEQEAQPTQPQGQPRRRSFLSLLGAMLLVALGFVLGLNAERLGAWIEQVAPWIHQVPVWLEPVRAWLEQVPAWFEGVKKLLPRR